MSSICKSPFSHEKACQAQMRLSTRIISEDRLTAEMRLVGGVDVAYTEDSAVGAAVVLDYDSLETVESAVAVCAIQFPYVPTLLSFRETRPILMSFRRLCRQPDVVLVDGHGIAHPRHCGLASHLGLILGKPTIGIAKDVLVGETHERSHEEDFVPVVHEGEVIAAMVATGVGCKPVVVSVGHMISLHTAIGIVRHCTRTSRFPEPIRRAHEKAVLERRKINI